MNVSVFFLANEYLHAQGLPGLADRNQVGEVYSDLIAIAEKHIGVAAGKLEIDDLVSKGVSKKPS